MMNYHHSDKMSINETFNIHFDNFRYISLINSQDIAGFRLSVPK